MTPQAAEKPAVGVHAPRELETVVRRVLTDVSLIEPLAVTETEAAKLLGISGKTLGLLPPEKSGKLHIGRAVRYHLPTLKRFAAELVGGSIEVPG